MANDFQKVRNELLEGPILRSLLKLSGPVILTQLLQSAYQLIDAFWVGRLGGQAVAAVSVTTPIMFLTIALGAGLAVAGSVLIAQYVGAGNQEMVDHVAAQTLLMVLIISVVLGAVGYACTPALLRLIGVAPEVYAGALGFMRVSFIGLPFNFLFIMFTAFMRGTGHPSVPVYIILGTVFLNFALDPVFIFGRGPVPRLGVMGAAMATLSTQVLATVIGMSLLFRGRHGIHVRLPDFRPDGPYIKRAFFLGLPASVEQSMRGLGITVMTFLITTFGTLSLASYGVGSNVLQLVMIPAMGLSQGISTLVAQNIGAGQADRAAAIGRLGAWLAFGALTLIGLLAFLLAPHLVAFFVPGDPAVIAGGTRVLRTMSLAWGFMGINLALTGVLRGSGNMVVSMILALVSQWVLQFPLAYILSHHGSLGVNGIWWAFPVTNVVIALVSMAVFARGDWKKKRLTRDLEAPDTGALEREVTRETFTSEGVR